ncbi:DUF397 domain-containing protein [Streptomyces sp. NPDC058045]|uniref:DUF397 domain-containing protein n=1 Tax=Streptomyces sp. NPDC058045 TaxID=3346311 RepID=UPI0036F0A40C
MQYNLTNAVWRKSSYSGGNNQCVEVADGFPDVMPVRDSKTPEGPCLVFGVSAWASFTRTVKDSELPSV